MIKVQDSGGVEEDDTKSISSIAVVSISDTQLQF